MERSAAYRRTNTKDEPCPCSSSKFSVRKIRVGGTLVGISGLDEILEEVYSMDLDEDEAASALLKKVKLYNYVPSKVENEYREALLEELRKFSE